MSDIKGTLIDLIFDDVKLRESVISFYKEYMGIELSIPQLMQNLSAMDNHTLIEILDNSYTDTIIRDDIHNIHSQLMIGENWPAYLDGPEAIECFMTKLQSAYVEEGYRTL